MVIEFCFPRPDQAGADMIARLTLARARVLGRMVSESRCKRIPLTFAPTAIDLSALIRRGLPAGQIALRTGLAPAVVEAFADGLAASRSRGHAIRPDGPHVMAQA